MNQQLINRLDVLLTEIQKVEDEIPQLKIEAARFASYVRRELHKLDPDTKYGRQRY